MDGASHPVSLLFNRLPRRYSGASRTAKAGRQERTFAQRMARRASSRSCESSIVVGAETFPIQQYGKYEKWIPACAGMTEKYCEIRMQDL
jgi:hypothetical protein